MDIRHQLDKLISKTSESGKALVYFFIAILSFIFSFQTRQNLFAKEGFLTDSSVFRYIAKTMLYGDMPYRDSFDHKGPLLFLINYLGLRISEDFGSWLIEFITITVTMVFMYRISRLTCNYLESIFVLIISFAPLFTYFEGGNLVEEYALPFISMSLFFFLDYLINDNVTAVRLLLCGAGLGAICFLRPNIAGLWVCFCAGIGIKLINEGKWKDLFRFTLMFLIGFFIIALPILIWLFKGNAISKFWQDYIVFNLRYSNSEGTDLWEKMRARSGVFIYFLFNTVFFVSVMIQLFITVKHKRYCDIVFTLFIFFNLLLISMSGLHYDHYGMISVPAVIYPYSRMIEAFHDKTLSNKRAMAGVLLILVLFFVLPGWFQGTKHVVWSYRNRNNNLISKEDLKVADLIKKNSNENEKIVICGNWDHMYLLSERFSCTRFSYQNFPCRLDENYNREFMNELAQGMPRIVVICDSAFVRDEVSDFCKENDYQRLDTEEDALTGKALYVRP